MLKPVLSFGKLDGANWTSGTDVQLFRLRHENESFALHQLRVEQEHVQPCVNQRHVNGERLRLVGLVLTLDAGRRIWKFSDNSAKLKL